MAWIYVEILNDSYCVFVTVAVVDRSCVSKSMYDGLGGWYIQCGLIVANATTDKCVCVLNKNLQEFQSHVNMSLHGKCFAVLFICKHIFRCIKYSWKWIFHFNFYANAIIYLIKTRPSANAILTEVYCDNKSGHFVQKSIRFCAQSNKIHASIWFGANKISIQPYLDL